MPILTKTLEEFIGQAKKTVKSDNKSELELFFIRSIEILEDLLRNRKQQESAQKFPNLILLEDIEESERNS